jgi:UDP-glucose 4-epimerase
MKDRVLVIGGSGFLGEFLVNHLIEKGYEVTIADIRKPEYLGAFRYMKFDLKESRSIQKVDFSDFEYVFNLGGFANLELSSKAPIEVMELNVMGNLRILEALKEVSIRRFIYASSAYALSSKGSFYGISKLTSEKLVEEYGKRWNLPYSIIRYGSVYSELNYDNNYVYQLIEEALKTNKIVHTGDGNEMREYIHAADAAKLTCDVMEGEDFLNSQVILTGVEKMKRKELFDMINEILDNRITIEFKNEGYEDHYKYTPYSFNASFNKKLVANPFIDIGQGILACVESISESLNEY